MMSQRRYDERMEQKDLRGTLIQHALVCQRCRIVLERLMLEHEGVLQHVLAEGILPPMRQQTEIQIAHDLLMEFLRDKQLRETLAEGEVAGQLAMAGDALCWALGHSDLPDHSGRIGRNFAEILQIISGALGWDERAVEGGENRGA